MLIYSGPLSLACKDCNFIITMLSWRPSLVCLANFNFPLSNLLVLILTLTHRHFSTDGRTGNGSYLKYSRKKFLDTVAVPDVRALHKCRTGPMFATLGELNRQCWSAHYEKKLAEVFDSNYVSHPKTNKWHCRTYQVFCEEYGKSVTGGQGLPTGEGIGPQTQSQESMHLELKGSKNIEPLIKTGLKLETMCNVQFPKMVYLHSLSRTGVPMEVRMLDDPKGCCHGDFLTAANELRDGIDISEHNNGEVMNTGEFLGVPITPKRKELHEGGLAGKFEGSWRDRAVLSDRVESLCHVTKKQARDGRFYFGGTCYQYNAEACCPHAVRKQYPREVKEQGPMIPNFRTNTSKRSFKRIGKKRKRNEGLDLYNPRFQYLLAPIPPAGNISWYHHLSLHNVPLRSAASLRRSKMLATAQMAFQEGNRNIDFSFLSDFTVGKTGPKSGNI